MGTTSLPSVTQQLLAAIAKIAAEPFRMMINGQIGDGGSAVSGQTYKEVQDLTNDEVFALFGVNSYLSNTIQKQRSICKKRFSIWVIALEPAIAGTAATLDFAYSGVATESKLMKIKPISEKLFSFNIQVEIDDTANDVALAVEAGLDALESNFPASNAVVIDTLTLTASDVGSLGNKYTVIHENIPAGILVNTNGGESRDQFAGGATDPVVSGIFDNVAATRFHSIMWPWETDFTEPDDFLTPRNIINNSFLQGVCYIGLDGTEAEIKAVVNGVTPLNSLNLFFMGNRAISGVSGIIEPSDWRIAEFAAIEGLRLTDGASISQYVTVDAPLDNVGGSALASLGYYATPLANTSPVPPELLFDEQEQVNLKADGYTIIGVNESANSVIMGEAVSTYKKDDDGNDDPSFKFLNYIRTGWLILEIYFRTVKTSYKQFRLTEGALVPRRAMANKGSITGKYLGVFKELGGADFVLCQAGGEAEKTFSDNLVVETDLAAGLVSSSGILPIVTQTRKFDMVWQMAFTIGG
jgi:phage tail sheath gpL-like